MGLILHATKASTHNFNQLISLKEPVSKETVITELAAVCIQESEKAHLGLWHTFKKFSVTTSVYTTLLLTPIAALLGSLWCFADKIGLLLTIENLSIAVPSLGALIATDVVFGKIFGVRPMTIALLATLDTYRNGVKKVTDIVEESYTNEEEAAKKLLEKNKEVLIEELKALYSQIAKTLDNHTQADIQKLNSQLPLIEKGLVSIGLTRIEVAQILAPLRTELRLMQKSMQLPSPKIPAQKRFWIF